jgi:hypothetical protein
MYKKKKVPQDQEFPLDLLKVDSTDGPEYPLFEFKGFGSRPTNEIKATTANYPRKSELIQSKLEMLLASTADFMWMIFGWPISIFVDAAGNEFQFDHRHLLRAMLQNGWIHAPVALYERKVTGIEVLDRLSDDSAMSLMGLRANATDNSENAGTKDFHILRRLMEDDGIPITTKNVNILLDAAGVNQRYPKGGHKSTIGGIRNAILETKVKSLRVFNTSDEEVKHWIANQPNFAKNKLTADGFMGYHKVLDERFYYRYANDILRWTWNSIVTGTKIRVCASSYAICEHQIEKERQEMVDTIKDILDNTINWYISWVEKRFANVGMKIDLPKVELSKLPLELYWIPQIEGETEAIRVDLK